MTMQVTSNKQFDRYSPQYVRCRHYSSAGVQFV